MINKKISVLIFGVCDRYIYTYIHIVTNFGDI
jgi:hypothetical protein